MGTQKTPADRLAKLKEIKRGNPTGENLSGYQSVTHLVKWYGGKYKQTVKMNVHIRELAESINATGFIECCGGGGHNILNLPSYLKDGNPSMFNLKVYNELDRGLAVLFQIVKTPESAEQLINYLNTIGRDENIYTYAVTMRNEDINTAGDKVESLKKAILQVIEECTVNKTDSNLAEVVEKATAKAEAITKYGSNSMLNAAYTFISAQLSFGGNACRTGCYTAKTEEMAEKKNKEFMKAVDGLKKCTEVLADVDIISEDYRTVMSLYGDDVQTIKLIDPPYHPETRVKNAQVVYDNDWTAEDHKELVQILLKSQSWILCGYDPAEYGCNDYAPLEEAGAVKVNLGTFGKSKKDEYIWIMK